MVLVILGVLSAYALPSFTPDNGPTGEADQLGRDLRHTQELAMTQGRTLTFDIQGGPDYRVADTITGVTVIDPATQQDFQITLENTLTGTDTDFDSLGRPVTGGALLTIPRVFTVAGGTVTVSPVTGFVSISP